MKDEADFGKRSKKEVTQNDDALEKYIAEKNYKFLVDGMLLKLAFQLRNIGLDAEFAGEKNTPKETIAQAEAENRIILTRNRNLMLTKKTCPLIKVVSNKTQGTETTPIDPPNPSKRLKTPRNSQKSIFPIFL